MIFHDHKNNAPRFIGDIWLINPNWQEGNELPKGWGIVELDDKPTDKSKNYVPGALEKRENVWYQTWEAVELATDEKFEFIQYMRNLDKDSDEYKSAEIQYHNRDYTLPEIP